MKFILLKSLSSSLQRNFESFEPNTLQTLAALSSLASSKTVLKAPLFYERRVIDLLTSLYIHSHFDIPELYDPTSTPAPLSREPSASSVRDRDRTENRHRLARDLSGLGYTFALCVRALELNSDDPQAAGSWLLDNSAQYVASHPELLEDTTPLLSPRSSRRGDGSLDSDELTFNLEPSYPLTDGSERTVSIFFITSNTTASS